jgi:hypothetical protein
MTLLSATAPRCNRAASHLVIIPFGWMSEFWALGYWGAIECAMMKVDSNQSSI